MLSYDECQEIPPSTLWTVGLRERAVNFPPPPRPHSIALRARARELYDAIKARDDWREFEGLE